VKIPGGILAAQPAWEPVGRVPTYELVLRRIEEQLLSRSLRPGDKLPPERELATLLGASRPAVREALRVLQAQGILRSSVGTGADSGTIVMSAPSGALTRLLKVHLAVASFPLSDVVQARVMLERFSAIGAAANRSSATFDNIELILTRMDDPDIGLDRFNELDTDFHVAIAESGGNRLIADLTVAIRESIRTDIHKTLAAERDWPTVRARLRSEHRRIYGALRDADGPLTADLLEQHIVGFYRHMTDQQPRATGSPA
jgi:GntR family transcriptional repressor for pyruvate dehydrogenase complex